MSFDGFHAGGHLTELALDRLTYDVPDGRDGVGGTEAERAELADLMRRARAHLAACAACAAARDALAARDAAFAIGPRADVVERAAGRVSSPRHKRWRAWTALAGVLAVAAVALLVTRPGDEPRGIGGDGAGDVVLAKGGAIELDVRVNDGARTRSVDDGHTVYPGERAGFALRALRDGFVVVFGWDTSGKPWVAYPSPADEAHLARVAAVPIAHSAKLQRVAAAVRFDEVLGDEHLAVVWCPAAFVFGDLVPPAGTVSAASLRATLGAGGANGSLGAGACALRDLTLHKQAADPGHRP